MLDNQKKEQGERLKSFREEIGIKQGDFAEKLSLKQGSYSDIERGKNQIGANILTELANTFKLNTNLLLTGEGEPLKSNVELFEMAIPNVRLMDVNVYAGTGLLPDREIAEWIYVPELGNRRDYYGLHVKGNSMQPTIMNGDVVVCKKLDNPKNDFTHNKVYVVVTETEVKVKRVLAEREKKGCVSLESDNLSNEENQPQSVKFSEIRAMFEVVKRITSLG